SATGWRTCATPWRAPSASPSSTVRRSERPSIPLTWLAEHTGLPADVSALQVATGLSRVGLEEEAIFGAQVTGPLVVGRVLALVREPRKDGRTINTVRVDGGRVHSEDTVAPHGSN